MAEASKINQDASPTETNQREEIALVDEEEVEQLKQSLPKAKWMGSKQDLLLNIQGFRYPISLVSNIVAVQRHFLAQDTDLVVTSFPKTGTTWLKSLLFSLVDRFRHNIDKALYKPIIIMNLCTV